MTSDSDLRDWLISHLTSLFGAAPSPEPTGEPVEHVDRPTQLNTLVSAAFAPDASFFLNHNPVDRTAYTNFLNQGGAVNSRAEIQCDKDACIETLVDQGNPDAGSIVAGTATVIHTHPWRIRAAPAKTRIVVVFSAKIKKAPEPQIVELFHTWAPKPIPIVMPGMRAAS